MFLKAVPKPGATLSPVVTRPAIDMAEHIAQSYAQIKSGRRAACLGWTKKNLISAWDWIHNSFADTLDEVTSEAQALCVKNPNNPSTLSAQRIYFKALFLLDLLKKKPQAETYSKLAFVTQKLYVGSKWFDVHLTKAIAEHYFVRLYQKMLPIFLARWKMMDKSSSLLTKILSAILLLWKRFLYYLHRVTLFRAHYNKWVVTHHLGNVTDIDKIFDGLNHALSVLPLYDTPQYEAAPPAVIHGLDKASRSAPNAAALSEVPNTAEPATKVSAPA